MSKILITGGAGFIGSHLTNYYLSRGVGHKVFVIDNFSTGKRNNLPLRSDNFDCAMYDVNYIQTPSLSKIFYAFRPDWVFHCASTVGVDRVTENPDLVIKDLDGIRNVISLSYEVGVSKFIFLSSSELYGENMWASERELSLDLSSPYQTVKRYGEIMCMEYGRTWQTYSFRLFNVYGEGQSEDFVIGRLLKKVNEGDSNFTIYKPGSVRDYTYIEDVVEATEFVILNSDGGIYNICTGKGTSIKTLVRTVESVTGFSYTCNIGSRKDVEGRIGDPSKLNNLGFFCEYPLVKGIEKMALRTIKNN